MCVRGLCIQFMRTNIVEVKDKKIHFFSYSFVKGRISDVFILVQLHYDSSNYSQVFINCWKFKFFWREKKYLLKLQFIKCIYLMVGIQLPKMFVILHIHQNVAIVYDLNHLKRRRRRISIGFAFLRYTLKTKFVVQTIEFSRFDILNTHASARTFTQ